jgi:hypothetical protein
VTEICAIDAVELQGQQPSKIARQLRFAVATWAGEEQNKGLRGGHSKLSVKDATE